VILWLVVGPFVAAAFLTGAVRRLALAADRLDTPNERSSHTVATARGGGLAIVLVTLAAAAVNAGPNAVRDPHRYLWMIGAALVAVVGFVDDSRGLSQRLRITAHCLAAAALVWSVGAPTIPWHGETMHLGALGVGMSFIATIWSINLFNFMDGTDGLAGAEAVFVFAAASALECIVPSGARSFALLVPLAAASLGFLLWNWPPARIFMGDVGSGYLGFLIAATALITSHSDGLSLWTWTVLYGAFIADSTVTLITRLIRRERIYVAHRSHAYQKLSRRWHSHRRVLLLFAAVNLGWLLPLAAWTVRAPGVAAIIAAVALLPLICLAVIAGAGRSDA
jgi:Fuc2NAc and GlcNAc transferase